MNVDRFGYNRYGETRETRTGLRENPPSSRDLALGAISLNPWSRVTAASMAVLDDFVVGTASPVNNYDEA
jgi:hypothetical protein